MAYRFTNTEKWNDTWFSELKPSIKLLFMYLCDQCDIAGFLEINTKKISFELGIIKQEVESGLNKLGKRIHYSTDQKYIHITNFIKHQKNLPLNEKNKVHAAIISRLHANLHQYNYTHINQFIQATTKELPSPISKSNSTTKEKENKEGVTGGEKTQTWRETYEQYQHEAKQAYDQINNDNQFINERKKYYPHLDIKLSLEKAYNDYWSTQAGWQNKKKSKTKEIDWHTTYRNTLDQKINHVYENKRNQHETRAEQQKDYNTK